MRNFSHGLFASQITNECSKRAVFVVLAVIMIAGSNHFALAKKDDVKQAYENYQADVKSGIQWSSLSPEFQAQIKQGVAQASQDINQNLQQMTSAQLATTPIEFTNETPHSRWWLDFGDDYLSGYIERALIHNPDAETARLRIQQLHAAVSQARSGLWPKLNTGFIAKYSKSIVGNSGQPGDTQTSDFAFVTPSTTVSELQAPFLLSFEPDIWGTTRLGVKARKQLVSAAEYNAQKTFQTIAAQVAITYLSLMEADALVEQQTQDVLLQQRLFATEETRFKVGVSTADKVSKQQEALTKSRTMLVQYQQQQYLALLSLAAWVGETPNKPEAWPRNSLTSWPLWTEVAMGTPSSTLLDHPDVKANEAELEKARIDVSVARRAFLPLTSFNGGFVLDKFRLGDVLNTENLLLTLLGSVSQPIFDAGLRKSNLTITKRQADIALQGYCKALIMTAKTINEDIASLQSSREIFAQKQEGLNALQKTLAVRQAQVKAGSTAAYNLYPVESQAVMGMQGWIQSRRQVLSSQIQLVSSLGSKL